MNERLEQGQEGKELVKWLNSLPEVQDAIRRSFHGQPISEQNLSQWKKGGYPEWQEKQERWHMLHRLREEAEEMGIAADPEETQRHLSVMLTLELARAVQEIRENTPDLKERLERLEPVIGKFAQLRREESNARRVEMAWIAHKREFGAGVGGFGLERALDRLEDELEEESQASAPVDATPMRPRAGRNCHIHRPQRRNGSRNRNHPEANRVRRGREKCATNR